MVTCMVARSVSVGNTRIKKCGSFIVIIKVFDAYSKLLKLAIQFPKQLLLLIPTAYSPIVTTF